MKNKTLFFRKQLFILLIMLLSAVNCGRLDLITSAAIGIVTSKADDTDGGEQSAPPEEMGTVIPVVTRSVHDSEPNYSSDNNSVIFVSEFSGSKDVWKVNSNGTQLARLTTSLNAEFSPVWSPDGTLIAFTSDSLGNQDIWLMSSNGTGLSRLTTDPENDAYPSFSPDGSQIVFTSTRSGNSDIWKIPVSGGTATQLTFDLEDDFRPSWSPSGGLIAYVSNRGGNRDVWVVPANGGTPERITEHASEDDMPVWSPTGKYIAFTSKRSGNWDIFLQEYGRVLQPLQATLDEGIDTGPAWLADESGLFFVSNRGGYLNIVEMTFYEFLPKN
ncbi:MAG: hypothetical protein GY863_08060 [bacterium]|nr:hypothetical protein [bacterium]